MPLERNPNLPFDEVQAPKKPHLALMAEGEEGEPTFMAIPEGSIIAIVMDPKDPVKGIFPFTPTYVSPKRIVGSCTCGQKNCTRKVTFIGTWTGLHPTGTDQISIRKAGK